MSRRERRRSRFIKRDLKSRPRSKQAFPKKHRKISTEKASEKTPALRPLLEKFARLVADGYKHVQAAIACDRSAGSASYLYSQPGVKERIAEFLVIKKVNESEVAARASLKAQSSNHLNEDEIIQHFADIGRNKDELSRDRIRALSEAAKCLKSRSASALRLRGWSSDEITALLERGEVPPRYGLGSNPDREQAVFIKEATASTFLWMTQHCKTRNDHWREEGRRQPYEPLPHYDYLKDLFHAIELENVVWIEKSRDLMISWACVGYFTLNAMIVSSRGVILQTQKMDKVIQLIDYAKCLYENQDPRLQAAFPLSKPMNQQAADRLEFANGSYIQGIPAGANQIRSYHPWGYLNDESSFQADAGSCYNEAISAVSGPIVFNSSAGPGWYADVRRDIFTSDEDHLPMREETEIPSYPQNSRAAQMLAETRKLPPQIPVEVRRGVSFRRTKTGISVLRFHYSCHPERDPERNPRWFSEERRKYTSQADWDREQEIMDEAGGGELVFAETLRDSLDKIVILDPNWRPNPEWKIVGGFDHGKTNPTALLQAYIDSDGNIIFAGEYYQPGREIWEHAPEIKNMRDFFRMDTIYADPSIFHSTQQQQQRPGHAAERARSIADLYQDLGIKHLCPFSGDCSDVSFAARLQLHWANLEEWPPTVRIVCRNFSERPQYGLHESDCPNLLWELMRARRVKLGDQQLLNRNASEKIVDKDNHARDAMKYVVMSYPEPSRKGLQTRVNERTLDIFRRDPTSAFLQYPKIVQQERDAEDSEPTYYAGNARRLIWQTERRLRRGQF